MQIEVLQRENYYGHRKRLLWMNHRIKRSDEVIEIGCGTGCMITIPLNMMGKNVVGIDIAEISIKEAKRIAYENGIEREIFWCKDVKDVSKQYDVVILSEVLEHISDEVLEGFVDSVCSLVKNNGKLLLTVPNGYGSYEKGQKYWKKRVEKFQTFLNNNAMIKALSKVKSRCIQGSDKDKMESEACPMTLSDSPHVQFFRYADIVDIFHRRKFELRDFSGSAMFSGVLINTYFVPPKPIICKINCILGDVFPKHSAGYYFEFVKKDF